MKIQCECGQDYSIKSQIPENGQVNFKCNECETYGFIFHNKVYVQIEPYTENILVKDTKGNL